MERVAAGRKKIGISRGVLLVLLMACAMSFSCGRKSSSVEGKALDLATGAVRFEVSSDGVITDSQTKLEWIVGPDQDTSYIQATQWVADCQVAGGGWRMPTRAELQSLYQKGVGVRNMDPVIKVTGWGLWAEPKDATTAWGFDFSVGKEDWGMREGAGNGRVIGVRSRP
jgi:hypothetical protein